jgi:hypothetical protein
MTAFWDTVPCSLIEVDQSTTRLKAKAVPLHSMKALGGEEIQLLFVLDLSTRWE